MSPIRTPADIDHDQLRELAEAARWVAKLEDTVGDLEDLVNDTVFFNMTDEEAETEESKDPADQETMLVALELVRGCFEHEDAVLEDRLDRWLAEDPEHWPIFRLAVMDQWQTGPGEWRRDVPRWVLTLGTNAAAAHFHRDPFGRRVVWSPDVLVEPPEE